MGGCRCTFKNCQNTTKTTENIHFFHYPVKFKDRCAIWIKNANKPEFCMLEEDQLRNKVICEQHFDEKWFPNSQKKRLLQGAIPTLDGGNLGITESDFFQEKNEPEPTYAGSEMEDIQILPANDDGTIFVLDTDTMFGRTQKIESYTYKNGMIVPSNSKPVKFDTRPNVGLVKANPKPVPSLPKKELEEETKTNQFDQPIKRPIQELQQTAQVSKVYKRIKTEIPEYCEGSSTDNTVVFNDFFERQTKDKNYEISINNKHIIAPPEVSISLEKNIDQSYLRKIDQHSRDIASIKKMLKHKTFDTKVDVKTALNAIREELPPSLFTVLSLCLNYKCDLTDEDVDFFTSMHKTSPEVYQLLVDKYKWNLPCVDIVEESSLD